MESSSWWVGIRAAAHERVPTRRTAQLLMTAAVSVAIILAGIWLFAPPDSRIDDSLEFATTVAPQVTQQDDEREHIDNGSLSIHVAGEVVTPGVHTMPTGSRVIDAITAANGPTDDALLDALNLAAFVADGERIYVPSEGEAVVGALPDVAQGVGAFVNINRATAAELEQLPGVGPATAAEIIRDRTANGPFSSIDDLTRVSGIGPATVEKLRDVAAV